MRDSRFFIAVKFKINVSCDIVCVVWRVDPGISNAIPQLITSRKLQCTQLRPKTASVVPPEDGCLTPETCRGSRHNKVIVKLKVY
jgi:hypothetical protein